MSINNIKVGKQYSNSTNKTRKVIDIHTSYEENPNSSHRYLVSYVIIGSGDKVHSCYMDSFLKWVNK